MLLLIALPAYCLFIVVMLAVHHRLVARPTPHWWAPMDGPPSNVRVLDRQKRR